jgi:hypothetical protein
MRCIIREAIGVELRASNMNMSVNRELGLHLSKSWKPLVSCLKECMKSCVMLVLQQLVRADNCPFQGLPFPLSSPQAFLALYTENGGSTFFQNIENDIPHNMGSHPSRQ